MSERESMSFAESLAAFRLKADVWGPITLGDLITQVEACDQSEPIWFDFGGCAPGAFRSYRGYYDQLAVEFALDRTVTAGAFLANARVAVGATHEGYNGGLFQMTRETPVWVANWGSGSDTAIVGVRRLPYGAVIETWRIS